MSHYTVPYGANPMGLVSAAKSGSCQGTAKLAALQPDQNRLQSHDSYLHLVASNVLCLCLCTLAQPQALPRFPAPPQRQTRATSLPRTGPTSQTASQATQSPMATKVRDRKGREGAAASWGILRAGTARSDRLMDQPCDALQQPRLAAVSPCLACMPWHDLTLCGWVTVPNYISKSCHQSQTFAYAHLGVLSC